MSYVHLVFPNQLFANLPVNKSISIYLVEEHLFFKHFNFHKMKLAFHRASMKCYADHLTGQGFSLKYIDSTNEQSDIRTLIQSLNAQGISEISITEVDDNWLEKRIKHSCEKFKIGLNVFESPLFINSTNNLNAFFRSTKKTFFQTSFYKNERKRLQLLVNDKNNPDGGKWTYDAENRKKYPKNTLPPATTFPQNTVYWNEAFQYVEQHFNKNIGELNEAWTYPVTFSESQNWLNDFLEQRFANFGTYEDAILATKCINNHSLLSPLLNTGLISPQTVVQHIITYAEQHNIEINNTEGLIRQIIGWREFIRGMYIAKGTFSRNENFWQFTKSMPKSFYTATTGIEPVDNTVKKVLKTGYCHHIERLMILGNFMLLCEIKPNAVYDWFMELFIDAYDWVMVPNVYGMSQFADGGTFATKPYLSGSNYILKMSDYKKGNWCATWDGLFWRFIHKNRAFFLKNPRLSMMVRTWDKKTSTQQSDLLNKAEVFLIDLK